MDATTKFFLLCAYPDLAFDADPKEQKWITVNGAHIPVGEGGELKGKVGKKISPVHKPPTKKSINSLKELEDSSNLWTRQSTMLLNSIKSAKTREETGRTDTLSNSRYDGKGLYIKADSMEKPLLSGLAMRFPKLVETTFTHGNNEARIKDINKLVKAMEETRE